MRGKPEKCQLVATWWQSVGRPFQALVGTSKAGNKTVRTRSDRPKPGRASGQTGRGYGPSGWTSATACALTRSLSANKEPPCSAAFGAREGGDFEEAVSALGKLLAFAARLER